MPIKKLSKHTVLKEGTILDPFNKETYKADLWIKDGYIEDIGEFDVPPVSYTHLTLPTICSV